VCGITTVNYVARRQYWKDATDTDQFSLVPRCAKYFACARRKDVAELGLRP
jgi:hypothetical protein